MSDRNTEHGFTHVANLSRFALESLTKLGIPATVAAVARHAGVDLISSAALATGTGMAVSALYNRFIEGIDRPDAFGERAFIAFREMAEGAFWGAGAAFAGLAASDPSVMYVVASSRDSIIATFHQVQQLVPDKQLPSQPQQPVQIPTLPAHEIPTGTSVPGEPFIDPKIVEVGPWCAAGAGAGLLTAFAALGRSVHRPKK